MCWTADVLDQLTGSIGYGKTRRSRLAVYQANVDDLLNKAIYRIEK